ncbi:adenylate/guanylate cyclase domain-containing protein [Flavobacteriales bacterium 33_180_T64]|nr:adenylate/guanylate cyclase domain-containing protein [Flavobacteriales bacterium 33_180_T64]
MTLSIKNFLTLLLQSLVFWTFAFFLFAFIRYNGINEELTMFFEETVNFTFIEWFDYVLFLGLIIGVFYAVIEFLFNQFLNSKLSLGVYILTKTLIYFIVIITLLSVFSFSIEEQLDRDLQNELGWWRDSTFFWNVVVYFIIGSLIFSFLEMARNKFGRDVFFKMLIGTYRKPKEEERILMFIDLKDSTTIAEQLGHVVYSRFIQDCFYDLNIVVNKYDAQIYQYVGDEVVLSWTYKKGLSKNNCVKLFFAFRDKLNKRESYYLSHYKIKPEFKAGLHGGKLMIAEVGSVKKELAYHGDVINTASRIQGQCNTYKASLLVSGDLLNKSIIKLNYNTKLLGDIALKGKQEKLKIYSIS